MRKVQTKINKKATGVLVTLFALILPFLVLADTVEIYNNVQSSASTGGNTAEGGEKIQTGESSASIEVKTVINGEEVESIQKEVKTSGSAEIKVEQNVTSSDNETIVETSIVETTEDLSDNAPDTNLVQTETNNDEQATQPEPEEEEGKTVLAIVFNFFSQIRSIFTNLFT